ncbi:MAG: aspartate kinase [Candidatus Omnitrophica bacterium]|nr:aspartate kinase [Candidatus Omnitrophota bacterium]
MARKKLVVQKFGGSSVANVERILNVARRVVETKKKGNNVVVVVSALGDTTDELIELAAKITDSPSERELDMLMSTGEQISISLLAMAIHKLGIGAISLTGQQVGIATDKVHTKARIEKIETKRIEKELQKHGIVIVAGFQGITPENEITTLGRGGSDMSAVGLAIALKADVCEIFTDVEGIYTTDPRIVKNARKLKQICYEEMLEMASMGAQVMQARSIEAASKFNIPLHVRSSFSEKEGTIISKEVKSMEGVVVRGVTLNKSEAKITICKVPNKPGLAAKIFETLGKANINVDMIIQNISETGATDISFTVIKDDLNKTLKVAKDLCEKIKAAGVISDADVAKISVVGIGMRSHSGVAAKMFKTLADEKINIEMISTSEIKISCVVGKAGAEKAVKALHKAFGLHKAS